MQMASESLPGRLFTIGHSNHEVPRFLALLAGAGIDAIADVRSQPVSKYLPHFSRPEMEVWLRDREIGYAFLGRQLGGRPGQPSLYDADGRVNYERVRRGKLFQEGIEELLRHTEELKIALLCAEEDPLSCHRGLMITPALVERGFSPLHVRGDGTVETMAQMEQRLLEVTGVGAGMLDGLFAASLSEEERRDLLAEAYRTQARRKGFRMREDERSTEDGE
jgi:uncharacterized protein (DUF488 family)